MRILGIESTAHTAGVGIWDTERGILLNVYDAVKLPFKPSEAAEHHAHVFPRLIKEALSQYKVDAVAYAEGPGMQVCLETGATMAHYISKRLGVPVNGVHHGLGHITIAHWRLQPQRPLYIYVSGVSTALIWKNRVLGRSLDTGMGNMLDSFARLCGMSSAKELYDWAYDGGRYVPLPWTLKGMNFSFSGFFTAARKIPSKKDAAYSLFETAFAQLVEATERAIHLYKPQEIIGVGGVFQNQRLQQMMKEMAQRRGISFLTVTPEFLRDNGAMIATAYFFGKRGIRVRRNYPLEEGIKRFTPSKWDRLTIKRKVFKGNKRN